MDDDFFKRASTPYGKFSISEYNVSYKMTGDHELEKIYEIPRWNLAEGLRTVTATSEE
jgi:hypothetical protein